MTRDTSRDRSKRPFSTFAAIGGLLIVGFVLPARGVSQSTPSSSSERPNRAPSSRRFRLAAEVGFEQLGEDIYLPLALKFTATFPVPELGCTWEGPPTQRCETRFRFGVQSPVRLRIVDRNPKDEGLLRDEDWDALGDYLRFVRFVEYGHPSGPTHARLGELGPLVLGHGTIVNEYYNVVTPDHYELGLRTSVETIYGGGTLFVDHLISPSLVGGRGYVRPWSWLDRSSWWTRLAVGTSLVADVRAPLRLARHPDRRPLVGPARRPKVSERRPTAIWGIDVELNVLDREVVSMTPYTDANHHIGLGTGWHAGLSTEVRPTAGLTLSNRLEFRLLGESYLPSYIGPLYEVHRYQFPGWGQLLPAPKLRVAGDLNRGRRWGGYGELTGEFFGHLMLSGGYANYQGPENGSLRLQLRLTPIERIRLGIFYFKQYLESFSQIFDRRRALVVGEGRFGIVGPLYLKGAYSLLWHLRDDGSYQPIRRWNVGAGASISF